MQVLIFDESGLKMSIHAQMEVFRGFDPLLKLCDPFLHS